MCLLLLHNLLIIISQYTYYYDVATGTVLTVCLGIITNSQLLQDVFVHVVLNFTT